jgi:hypothetical protein
MTESRHSSLTMEADSQSLDVDLSRNHGLNVELAHLRMGVAKLSQNAGRVGGLAQVPSVRTQSRLVGIGSVAILC